MLFFLSPLQHYDLRNIKAISDLGRFQTFLGLLATRAGKLLNMSEIAKECAITQPTVKDWISILESTYIIYLLKPYHGNHSKRLIKSPKLYFTDTGLLAYLLGIETVDRFFKSSERGAIFENMVIMEYKKRLAFEKGHTQLYFYRTSSGVEVDLLVEKQGIFSAYEIKMAKTLSKKMIASLNVFQKEHDCKTAKILSMHEEDIALSKNIKGSHWSNIFLS